MSDEYLDDDIGLKPGVIVESSKTKYVIIKLLGEGGFGAVYKVHDYSNKDKCYATKVKRSRAQDRNPSPFQAENGGKSAPDDPHTILMLQIMILKMVSAERKQSHFTTITDRGKKNKEGYLFLVMELVFSIPTDLGVGMQCLEAVEDLHKHGFIHRDLKPANYACGLGDKKHVVYILDCGIARRMLNDKSELKAPREYVRFKGTVRFASVNCHKNIELGWKDDCESCLYLVLDLIVASGLPWKRMSDKHEILKVPA